MKAAASDLTFHVVFVPGTVRFLRLSTLSLLEFTPYRYRLISNGLGSDEIELLRRFCDSDPRLQLVVHPAQVPLLHATLLTLLESQNEDAFFCFADSDLFASEDFHEELEAKLADCDVFSSGGRIGFSEDERRLGHAGPEVESETGLPLATTFFSVYRSAPLRRVIRETGLSFEVFAQDEQLPARMALWLDEMGIGRKKFDTGKLMNIMAHRYGVRFRYEPLAALHHVGGLTAGFRALTAQGKARRARWGRPRSRGPSPPLLGWVQQRRVDVGSFFALFLSELIEERELPAIPAALRVDPQLARTCDVIRELYARHRDRLAD